MCTICLNVCAEWFSWRLAGSIRCSLTHMPDLVASLEVWELICWAEYPKNAIWSTTLLHRDKYCLSCLPLFTFLQLVDDISSHYSEALLCLLWIVVLIRGPIMNYLKWNMRVYLLFNPSLSSFKLAVLPTPRQQGFLLVFNHDYPYNPSNCRLIFVTVAISKVFETVTEQIRSLREAETPLCNPKSVPRLHLSNTELMTFPTLVDGLAW